MVHSYATIKITSRLKTVHQFVAKVAKNVVPWCCAAVVRQISCIVNTISMNRKQLLSIPFYTFLKVTVQFETEGSGQKEIVKYMDRSEVKL